MERTDGELKPEATPLSHERGWVAALCLLAALHVFVYAAAFPFFNNADEVVHLDTVVKYSHGHIPRGLEPCSPEMIRDQILYDSRAFLGTTNDVQLVSPPFTWPFHAQVAWIGLHTPVNTPTNYEATQPPLYYLYTGGWWQLGGRLNVGEGNRLYGLHFLNIPVVMLVVWLSWLVARDVFPDQPFRRLAVPAFISLMPQSAFYSIQNDVLSPLFFGLAFLGLLRFWRAEVPGTGLGMLTGLALALAFLSKITNTFPIAAFIVMLAVLARRHWRQGNAGKLFPSYLALGACAGLPALAWMVWCKLHYGDLTGSRLKAVYWTWTPKPFLQWWHHPIFTPPGAGRFFFHFLAEFWQGELVWYLQPMTFRPADFTYSIATICLLALPLVKISVKPGSVPAWQRQVLWMSFCFFAVAVLFQIYISISFDFNECPAPSRGIPYLFAGRQALGALIPFMLLFVTGLDIVLQRFRERAKFVILALLLLIMTSVEAASSWPAFFSPFNWFHM